MDGGGLARTKTGGYVFKCWEQSGQWDTEDEPGEVKLDWESDDAGDAAAKYVEDIYDNRDGWESSAETWVIFVRDHADNVSRVEVYIGYERTYHAGSPVPRVATTPTTPPSRDALGGEEPK